MKRETTVVRQRIPWGYTDRIGERVVVRHGEREVEVYISPTGRSIRVFVDGIEVES